MQLTFGRSAQQAGSGRRLQLVIKFYIATSREKVNLEPRLRVFSLQCSVAYNGWFKITAPSALCKALPHEWKYFWLVHSPGNPLCSVYSASFKHWQGRGPKLYTERNGQKLPCGFLLWLGKVECMLEMLHRYWGSRVLKSLCLSIGECSESLL